MSLENFFSLLKDRFEYESKRDNHVEKKTHQFIFVSIAIIPLIKYLEIETYAVLIVIPTLIISILFVLVLKVRVFEVPTNPDYYICHGDKINEEILKKDMELKDDELSEFGIRHYIKSTSYNKKIVNTKVKYLKFIQYGVIIQIFMLGGIFAYSTLIK